jgi:hypothetical protein
MASVATRAREAPVAEPEPSKPAPIVVNRQVGQTDRKRPPRTDALGNRKFYVNWMYATRFIRVLACRAVEPLDGRFFCKHG